MVLDTLESSVLSKVPSFRDDFPGSSLDSLKWTEIIGSGQALDVSGSLARLQMGTTANSTTKLESVDSFSVPCRISLVFSINQRIENQRIRIGLVDGTEANFVYFEISGDREGRANLISSNNGSGSSAILNNIPNLSDDVICELDIYSTEVRVTLKTTDPSSENVNSLSYSLYKRLPDPSQSYKLVIEAENLDQPPESSTLLRIDSAAYILLSSPNASLGTVSVDNFPPAQAVSGTVNVGNFPTSQTVVGQVDIGNFPATQAIVGTVNVANLPASQTVDGQVDIGNFPTTQAVSGTVNVGNLPASQTVEGQVDIGNFPTTQNVQIVDSLNSINSAVTAPSDTARGLLTRNVPNYFEHPNEAAQTSSGTPTAARNARGAEIITCAVKVESLSGVLQVRIEGDNGLGFDTASEDRQDVSISEEGIHYLNVENVAFRNVRFLWVTGGSATVTAKFSMIFY